MSTASSAARRRSAADMGALAASRVVMGYSRCVLQGKLPSRAGTLYDCRHASFRNRVRVLTIVPGGCKRDFGRPETKNPCGPGVLRASLRGRRLVVAERFELSTPSM